MEFEARRGSGWVQGEPVLADLVEHIAELLPLEVRQEGRVTQARLLPERWTLARTAHTEI